MGWESEESDQELPKRVIRVEGAWACQPLTMATAPLNLHRLILQITGSQGPSSQRFSRALLPIALASERAEGISLKPLTVGPQVAVQAPKHATNPTLFLSLLLSSSIPFLYFFPVGPSFALHVHSSSAFFSQAPKIGSF